MRWLRAVLLILLLPPLAAWSVEQGTLAIRTADGKDHVFTIELAQTDAEREYGLMNRPSMPADHGMLFDFGADQRVAMWMKDTLIPLDMFFIDRAGKIVAIAQRAVPLSEEIIDSRLPVRAVLELNGGTAERLGIANGDTVIYPIFGNAG